MKIKLTLATIAILIAGTVAALAQTTFFTAIGDLIFPFKPPGAPTSTTPGKNGSIGDPVFGGMAPVNGNLSYTKAIPTTGFSLTFGNWQEEMVLAPAGTLAAGYVTMAPAPVDGGKACVFSSQQITAFYTAAGAGQSINNAFTGQTLAATSATARTCFLYSQSNKTWDRSQ